jgi:hypothetical protein
VANFYNLQHDITEMLSGNHSPEHLDLRHETAHGIVRLAKNIATHTLDMVNHRPITPKDPTLKSIRMSELGEPCLRKLMYKWYHPSLGQAPYSEAPHPYLPVKFTYGDYIEELTLFLAQEAGHEVRDRQKEVITKRRTPYSWYAVGHMDAVISNVIVDVKSAADVSFKKYQREGLTEDNDTFGYRWQLDAYALAEDNPNRAFLFTNKHDGEIHVVDRSGEIFLDIEGRIDEIGTAADLFLGTSGLPDRRETVKLPEGEKLDTVCSYCAFKWACYDGDIRGVIKSGRPLYFVKSSLTEKGMKLVTTNAPIPTPKAFTSKVPV